MWRRTRGARAASRAERRAPESRCFPWREHTRAFALDRPWEGTMIATTGLGRIRAALCLSLPLLAAVAAAAPFTPGNVVVYRIGNGTGSLVAAGNPVFLHEYTPAGVKVQSIGLPTAASRANKT